MWKYFNNYVSLSGTHKKRVRKRALSTGKIQTLILDLVKVNPFFLIPGKRRRFLVDIRGIRGMVTYFVKPK